MKKLMSLNAVTILTTLTTVFYAVTGVAENLRFAPDLAKMLTTGVYDTVYMKGRFNLGRVTKLTLLTEKADLNRNKGYLLAAQFQATNGETYLRICRAKEIRMDVVAGRNAIEPNLITCDTGHGVVSPRIGRDLERPVAIIESIYLRARNPDLISMESAIRTVRVHEDGTQRSLSLFPKNRIDQLSTDENGGILASIVALPITFFYWGLPIQVMAINDHQERRAAITFLKKSAEQPEVVSRFELETRISNSERAIQSAKSHFELNEMSLTRSEQLKEAVLSTYQMEAQAARAEVSIEVLQLSESVSLDAISMQLRKILEKDGTGPRYQSH